ncbi:MAG: hypothetical protein JWO70_42 [Betaproteobacteria bacterium]|nr:hypothetical protein [Betaproteobacteria bacterium]
MSLEVFLHAPETGRAVVLQAVRHLAIERS